MSMVPQDEELEAGCSSVTLYSTGTCVWSQFEMTPSPEGLGARLRPGCPLVIGRQEGGAIEYLDPNYRPTQLAPDSSRTILSGNGEKDIFVSRGHFMLSADPRGVLLTNAVPHRQGGIRPPVNGTWLLEPERRALGQGEGYLIERGRTAKIYLPNQAVILISAD
jgi:hypothetical protein